MVGHDLPWSLLYLWCCLISFLRCIRRNSTWSLAAMTAVKKNQVAHSYSVLSIQWWLKTTVIPLFTVCHRWCHFSKGRVWVSFGSRGSWWRRWNGHRRASLTLWRLVMMIVKKRVKVKRPLQRSASHDRSWILIQSRMGQREHSLVSFSWFVLQKFLVSEVRRLVVCYGILVVSYHR